MDMDIYGNGVCALALALGAGLSAAPVLGGGGPGLAMVSVMESAGREAELVAQGERLLTGGRRGGPNRLAAAGQVRLPLQARPVRGGIRRIFRR